VIRNPHLLEAFEREIQRRSPPDLNRGLRIAAGLLQEAKDLGVWTRKDPWEGVAQKVEFARRLHVLAKRPAAVY
jgi:hypothetical protein